MKNTLLYNALYGGQVGLSLVFQILFARHYGASVNADVYFASQVIFSFLSTGVLFFTEMFMQHYNDLRERDPNDAARLYQTVFCLSVLLSLVATILSRALLAPLGALLLPGFQQEHFAVFISFANLLLLFLLISPLVNLNNSLINSEMRFGLPYLLGLLYPASSIGALLFFSKSYGLEALAVAPIVSGALILCVQHVYIAKRLRIWPAVRLWHPRMWALITTSLAMRLGHQLYALKDPITTSILSTFPTGAISIFSYAQKIIAIVHSVTNAPVLQVYLAKVSRYVSQGNIASIRVELRTTVLLNVGLFLCCILPLGVFLPKILALLFGNKFTAEEVSLVHVLFLALIPYYLVLAIEAPYSAILIALKQGLTVIRISIAFLVVFGGILMALKGSIVGIYALPAALFLAQATNLTIYVTLVRGFVPRTPDGSAR